MEEDVKFKKLIVRGWQQFRKVEVEVHPRLTIITGANGSGKSTLLGIFAKHFDWPSSRPLAMFQKKSNRLTRILNKALNLIERYGQNVESFGTVDYSNTAQSEIIIRGDAGLNELQYDYEFTNDSVVVEGLFIPSHRTPYRYQALESIPANIDQLRKNIAYRNFNESVKSRYFGENSHLKSPNYRIKEILIAWNTFGYGNDKAQSYPEFVDYFVKFEEILRKMLPPTLGFQGLSIQRSEVVLNCSTGSFYIDSSSGGVMALIDMAWQIYMFHEDKSKSFTVVIDEVENHLHPAMQRQLLPNLLSAFPNVTFIVSTHSPLMINSVRDSNIYALKYVEREIETIKLDLDKSAKTSSQILDEVLGVSFTMPVWAEEVVDRLIAGIESGESTEDDFKQLRQSLSEAGLENLMPEAIEKIVEAEDDQTS